MSISRPDAFRVAADVLERSDWLTVDLLADAGDENANENAEEIVRMLREEVARSGRKVEAAPRPAITITASPLETLAQAVLDGRVLFETRRDHGPDGPVVTATAIYVGPEEYKK